MKITGKTALITGASRGIGKAIALELAHQGVNHLLLLARDAIALTEVADQIRQMDVKADILVCDLRQTEQLSIVISQAWRDHGPIDLLVNCAGIAHQHLFVNSNLRNIQEEIGVNLIGLYTITRLMARRMVTQRDGVIVNVSSLMGKLAAPTMATYSATKFAVLGLTQALRCELLPYNVRVLALLPSLTDTDMVKSKQRFRFVLPSSPEEVAQALIAGLQKESSEIYVGWQGHIAALLYRIVPSIAERLIQLAAPPALTRIPGSV